MSSLPQLQSEVRDLVDGYEYLQQVATQQSDSLVEMAAFYREQMENAASTISPLNLYGEKENKTEEHGNRNLDMLKMELQSISHERVIVDVLTRNTISHSKHVAAAAARSSGATSTAPSSSSRLYKVTAASSSAASASSSSSSAASSLAAPFANLDGPIPIPSFDSVGADDRVAEPTEKTNRKPQQRVVARRVPSSSIMVPSLRQGSIPPELQNLRTTPTAAPPPAPSLDARPPAKRKSRKADVAIQGFSQVVRSFKTQLQSSQQDLQSLKAHVDSRVSTTITITITITTNSSEKSGVQRQLKSLLHEVKKQQEEQQAELLGEVDRAVDTAMGKLAQMIKPRADEKKKITAHIQQQQAVLLQQQEELAAHRERQRVAQRALQQRLTRDRSRAHDPRDDVAFALGMNVRQSADSAGSQRSTASDRRAPAPTNAPTQASSSSSTSSSTLSGGYRVLAPRSAGDAQPAIFISEQQAQSLRSQASSSSQATQKMRGTASLSVPTPSTPQSGPLLHPQSAIKPPGSSKGRVNANISAILNSGHANTVPGAAQKAQVAAASVEDDGAPRAVRFETQLVGDDRGVKWNVAAHSSPRYEPPPPARTNFNSIVIASPAPSLHDLQTIPGSEFIVGENAPIVQIAPADILTVTSQASDGGVSKREEMGRNLGVISNAPLLVIAGSERLQRMDWERERHADATSFGYGFRSDRARLPTESVLESESGNMFSIAAPAGTIGEQDHESLGPSIKVGRFYSSVQLKPSEEGEGSTDTRAGSSAALERQNIKNFERLIGTVVDGQKAIISEVLSSQAKIAEELTSSRIQAATTAAAAPTPSAAAALSEERVIALMHQYLQGRPPSPIVQVAAPPTWPVASPTQSNTPSAPRLDALAGHIDERLEAHAQSLEIYKQELTSQVASQLSTQSDQLSAQIGSKLSAELIGQMAARDEKQLATMEDSVKRGIEEGVEIGVRRTLQTMEALREEAEIAARLEQRPRDPLRQESAQRVNPHVPESLDLLQAIQKDAQESRAAVEALKRGFGFDLYKGRSTRGSKPMTRNVGVKSSPDQAWLDDDNRMEEAAVAAADNVGSTSQVRFKQEEKEDGDAVRQSLSLVETDAFPLEEVDDDDDDDDIYEPPPGTAPSRRRVDEPEELSTEIYADEDDGDAGGVSWSLSEDDGDAFLLRHVDPAWLLSEKGKANLRGRDL